MPADEGQPPPDDIDTDAEGVETWPPEDQGQRSPQAAGPDREQARQGHREPPPSPEEPRQGHRQRGLDDREARNWATLAHVAGLSWFVGVPGILAVLVVWLVKRDEHPLVDDQGREALNFQISMLIYGVVSVVLVFVLVGIVLLLGLMVFGLVMPIVAAVKANDGERYRYPLTMRLISESAQPRPQSRGGRQANN